MSIEQFIANEVKSNDVVLFMKGTPQFPQCGFSATVVQVLSRLGLKFKGVDILAGGVCEPDGRVVLVVLQGGG